MATVGFPMAREIKFSVFTGKRGQCLGLMVIYRVWFSDEAEVESGDGFGSVFSPFFPLF